LAKHQAEPHNASVSSNFPKELDSPAFTSGHFFCLSSLQSSMASLIGAEKWRRLMMDRLRLALYLVR
jgi:hypothetical protein